MADEVGKGVFVSLEDGKRAHKVFGRACPHGFEAHVAAHKHLVGVAVKRPHIDKMAHGDIGAAAPQECDAFGNGGQKSRAFKDDVGTFAAGCIFAHNFRAFFRVWYVGNIDGEVCAELFCQFQTPFGTADHDEPPRAADFGGDEGEQADGSRSLYDNGVAKLQARTHRAVYANGKRLGDDRNFGGHIGFEHQSIGIPQVDIFAKTTPQIGGFFGL